MDSHHFPLRRFAVRVLAVTIAVVTAVTVPAGQASAAPYYQVRYDFAVGLAASLATPGAAPPGANNWSCRPTAAHPYPVVLVHGTFANMTNSWQAGSALLANDGYCVFALDYGGAAGSPLQGYGDIATSAHQLATFVTRVLAATGARKVDIVGHSQGGLMPRYYLRFLGGAATVHTLVGLAPSNHGTTLDGLTALLSIWPGGRSFVASLCAACAQQVAGSAFLTTLNGGGDTVADVSYTVIETRYDEVVTPYTSAFLQGAGVTNITLQDSCSLDHTDHVGITYDQVAWGYVRNALDPAHARTPACVAVLPVVGG